MTTTLTTADAVDHILHAGRDDIDAGFALADELSADDGTDLRSPLYAAAALTAATWASIDAAAAFTRERSRPRPVPGVETATADPFTQTVLGHAWTEVQGADASVRAAARDIDDADDLATPSEVDRLRARALAAFDVAAGIALHQGEHVWEIVGTSGSGREHGFQTLWIEARRRSTNPGRAPRRREIGRAALSASK